MKTKSMMGLLTTLLITQGSALASNACKQSISKESRLNGETTVTLRKFTLEEICGTDIISECRADLESKKLKLGQEFAGYIQNQLMNEDLSLELSKEELDSAELISILLSNRLKSMKVHDKKLIELGDVNFYSPVPVRSAYPLLRVDYGTRRTNQFLVNHAAGITQNLDEIQTWNRSGTYYTTALYRWYLPEVDGPEIRAAIAKDHLVVTRHSKINRLKDSAIFSPFAGKRIEIPYQYRAKKRGISIQVDTKYVIECKEIQN